MKSSAPCVHTAVRSRPPCSVPLATRRHCALSVQPRLTLPLARALCSASAGPLWVALQNEVRPAPLPFSRPPAGHPVPATPCRLLFPPRAGHPVPAVVFIFSAALTDVV